jgi:acyl-CoA thioester hydrolase
VSSTILVIDDDQTLVAPLKEGLESAGYRVAVAFDGMQGLVQAHQAKPDVIILDYYMPGGGGVTVYDRLRATESTSKVPIVFSTNVTLEEIRKNIRPTPQTFFLKKPVGLRQMLDVINGILGQSRQMPEATPRPNGPAAAPAASAPSSAAPPQSRSPEVAAAPAGSSVKPVSKAGARVHEYEVRVTYADTDKMGIIYYANYFKYFELGRTELMRSLGVRYRDLEVQRKLFLPCVETGCRYVAPSRYDDLLVVRTWLSDLGRASARFENEIVDKDLGGKVVARGFSRHAVVNDLWRPARIPEDLLALLKPFVK